MFKIKVRWSGFTGAPGWTNFYFDTVDDSFHDAASITAAGDRVMTFLNAIKTKLPPAVTLQVQADAEIIAPTNGKLSNVGSAGVRAPVVGTAVAQSYAAPTGAVITWRTAGVRNGRRVRGRTFLVPCVAGMFQNDGTIQPGDLTEIGNAASALYAPVANVGLGVYSRPTAPGANDGDWFAITSASVPDMAAVLRSRRG